MKCKDIIKVLEELAPCEYAENWDNVGLLVGDEEKDIKKIVIALDATMDVIEYCIEVDADLLITHHPLIFKAVKQINNRTVTGRKILALAKNQISYYAMHTNFDTKGGMAKLAAKRVGLNCCEVLDVTNEDGEGIGQIGLLSEEMSVCELVQQVKDAFELPFAVVYGDETKKVKRVAISPGSGKSEIATAIAKNAEVLITGDIGHHEGLDAIEDGLCIIDATHYGLEYIFIDFMKEYLAMHTSDEITCIVKKTGIPCKVL